MKIFLKPGEKLIVGFYTPAGDGGGWHVPKDMELDGQLKVEFNSETGITVCADMADDEGRIGIIYQASE